MSRIPKGVGLLIQVGFVAFHSHVYGYKYMRGVCLMYRFLERREDLGFSLGFRLEVEFR